MKKQHTLPAIGDIRKALVVLSDWDEKIKTLFEYRFRQGKNKGHSLGNLIMVAAWELNNCNLEDALKDLHRLFLIPGHYELIKKKWKLRKINQKLRK